MNIHPLSALALTAVLPASYAAAAITFDQNVTPDVIFGGGNDNGSFTVDQQNNIEVGLRGKLRFNASNSPENTFNSNGDGTYTFTNDVADGVGFANARPWQAATTPTWNVEWSLNSDLDGTQGRNLADLKWEIGFDFDPDATGTNFQVVQPLINGPLFDHSFGDNATGNGQGAEATDVPSYAGLIANSNVAQNSWSYEFLNFGLFSGFDPAVAGTFDVYIRALDSNDAELARTDIQIITPEPASAALLGLGALAMLRRRA